MRGLIVLSALVACALAAPGYLHGGYVSHPTVYSAPHVAYSAAYPVSVTNQHVAQNTLGQYNYGYADGLSAKNEVRGIDGSVAGAYSYVDAKGELQKVEYTADSRGFKVAASNLPVGPVAEPLVAPVPVQDTPEVMEARNKFLAKFEEVKNRKVEVPAPVAPVVASAPVAYHAPAVAYSAPLAYNNHIAYSAPVAYSAPIAYSAPAVSAYSYSAPAYAYSAPAYSYSAPAYAYSAPVAAVSSQYHAQDEVGQYTYGYNGGLSAKAESKTFDGVTRGEYSYVDANGLVQKVAYTADDVNGFRVAATNLPVGPVAPAVPVAVTVPETQEVAALKAAHLMAHEEAKQRLAKAL